jgi:hypothetical protein
VRASTSSSYFDALQRRHVRRSRLRMRCFEGPCVCKHVTLPKVPRSFPWWLKSTPIITIPGFCLPARSARSHGRLSMYKVQRARARPAQLGGETGWLQVRRKVSWRRVTSRPSSGKRPADQHAAESEWQSLCRELMGTRTRSWSNYGSHPEQTRKSPARRIGTPIPGPGRIGNRGFPSPFPGQIGNRGFPPRFPAKKSGNRGNRESDFLSDEYQLQWTQNILSREYHASAFTGSMRLLFRVRDSEREHAAVSDEHQLQ